MSHIYCVRTGLCTADWRCIYWPVYEVMNYGPLEPDCVQKEIGQLDTGLVADLLGKHAHLMAA